MQKTTSPMWRCGRAAVLVGILLALALPLVGFAQPVILTFESTAMLASSAPAPDWPSPPGWPPNGANASVQGLDATGYMMINQVNGQTNVVFSLRGARPNTLYTIWAVFKPLKWCTALDSSYEVNHGCPTAAGFYTGTPDSAEIRPGFNPFPSGPPYPPPFPGKFYPEAGSVAPTASMAAAFTNGMGADPGLTFTTNGNGNGQVQATLDYNLLGTTYDDGPPVVNKDVVAQCVAAGIPTSDTCLGPSFTVTSSWLRKFIIQVPAPADPVTGCYNYDPNNPASLFWQCLDPNTVNPGTGIGLPRVWRFPFDHFRLAAHPDGLTHGFIGGSRYEHVIDMVGRRCRLQPPLSGEPTC